MAKLYPSHISPAGITDLMQQVVKHGVHHDNALAVAESLQWRLMDHDRVHHMQPGDTGTLEIECQVDAGPGKTWRWIPIDFDLKYVVFDVDPNAATKH